MWASAKVERLLLGRHTKHLPLILHDIYFMIKHAVMFEGRVSKGPGSVFHVGSGSLKPKTAVRAALICIRLGGAGKRYYL